MLCFLVPKNSLLSSNSPSLEVFMCTRSTPGSITYEKCEGIPPVQYVKVSPSSTRTFILQETFSESFLTEMEGNEFQNSQHQVQGNMRVRTTRTVTRSLFMSLYYV